MTSNEIQKADLLDILFDNRNKQYGAYTLRKYYPQRLFMALAMTFGWLLLLLLLLKNDGEPVQPIPRKPEVVVKSIQIPHPRIVPPPPPVRPRTTASPSVATEQFSRVRYVKATSNVVPDQLELATAAVGPRKIQGIIPTAIAPPEIPVVRSEVTKDKPQPAPPVSREPEFPGGMKAWISYLQENLVVPPELQAGESKTVLMRFKVADDGTVTGFEVLRSAGNLYDQEVIRVLRRMPRWKPALENGVAVARQFTQPVTFVGIE